MAFDTGQAATLTGLILYLEKLAEKKRDMRYPPKGHDAVTLITYHSAKGLEWPVVILSGLDSGRSPDMWSPVVNGGGQADDPLHGRTLRSWTWPFGMTEGEFPRRRSGSGLDDDALQSPEGRERAARDAEENLRLLYVGCTRAKEKLVFAHRKEKYQWLRQLTDADTLLNARQAEGEHTIPGVDTTLVVRRLAATMANDCRVQTPTSQPWLRVPINPASPPCVPRYHSPSQQPADDADAMMGTTQLPGPSYFPSDAKEDQFAAMGDAVHAYMASLPSTRALGDGDRLRIAERCLSAFSVTGLLSPTVLVSAGERFCAWVQERYHDARWHTEAAMTGPRATGGQWFGTGDLLLDLPDGSVVILDHKSAPIRREHCRAKAATFASQVRGYCETVTVAGQAVRSAFIHFPLAGVIVEMKRE